MPDITMCANGKCERRTECWRFQCEPDKLKQSYAMFAPKDGRCDGFMDMFKFIEVKRGR